MAGQGLYAGHNAMHCAQYAEHNTEDSMWGLYAGHYAMHWVKYAGHNTEDSIWGLSMHCMVLYEGQLTDHSHPRLPSQGRATRSHPHLGDVALVKNNLI